MPNRAHDVNATDAYASAANNHHAPEHDPEQLQLPDDAIQPGDAPTAAAGLQASAAAALISEPLPVASSSE